MLQWYSNGTRFSLRSALDGVNPGSPVGIQVERDGELQYATFEME